MTQYPTQAWAERLHAFRLPPEATQAYEAYEARRMPVQYKYELHQSVQCSAVRQSGSACACVTSECLCVAAVVEWWSGGVPCCSLKHSPDFKNTV